MEVRGSVILGCAGEENTWTPLEGGFADLGRPLEPHEKDNVPRILVTQFKRLTKSCKIHSVFSNFGTVTYLAIKDQKAVVEFSSRSAVDEILKCKFLKIQGSHVQCELLHRFLHVEQNQFQVDLHVDLEHLDSKEAFEHLVTVLREEAEENSEDVSMLCTELETLIRPEYRDCKVYPFGSRVTRLGLRGCDLDIFLDCGKMYDGEFDQHPQGQQHLLETVVRQMLRCKDFARINKILHARVPILKFFHRPTGIHGDVAFKNGLGVENTKLLNFLLSVDKRLQSFFLFLKMWARKQSLRVLTENGSFTSYSLVMMAIFYLQQLPEPVLPAIRTLMEMTDGPQRVIAGWPCKFMENKQQFPKTKNTSSVLELAKGFFHFYQFFHFEWVVICPYLGKAIERQDLEEVMFPTSEIATHFPSYVNHLQNEGEALATHAAVCVQDPFEHSHNLTRCVKNEVLMNFISSCGLMYEKICTFT